VKVVLDTNVLLAAYGFGGVCLELVELCLARHNVILSEHILGELLEHLQGKFGVDEQRAIAITGRLRASVSRVVPLLVSAEACRDADDLPVLGTLLAADGDCLVTGDRDLLGLGEFSGLPILSPRQLLARLRQSVPPSRP
jgi:putative PIN family toxin of toxin-antitoxin system